MTHRTDSPAVTPGSPVRIIRLPEVKHLAGISRSTIYEKMKNGTFPQSRQLGSWIVGWSLAEVQAWVADPR